MLVRRTKSDFGRLVSKPHSDEDEYHEEYQEDSIPIQDQLEAITIKIHLKEKYNRVLKDELEESKHGANSVLKDLHKDTVRLRIELAEALHAEKMAVQRALRSHHRFQLAMTDRPPQIAVPWLDDKLFEVTCRINRYVHKLEMHRKKLETAEEMVEQIERWPRPGVLPWEIAAITSFHRYLILIERMKVKLETVNILHSKYAQIANVLRDERGKYRPAILSLQDQLRIFKKELTDLQKTLNYANAFRDAAIRNLVKTQKEASENRRRRRMQMMKVKTAVRKVLESLVTASAAEKVPTHFGIYRQVNAGLEFGNGGAAIEVLRIKRAEIEKFEDRASRLVDTMRVPDLTYVPVRLQSVMSLAEKLQLDLLSKEELLDTLIHQKAQLHIFLAHFSYTGHSFVKDFEMRVTQFKEAIDGTRSETKEMVVELDKTGDKIVGIRVGSLRILEQLDERKFTHHLKGDVLGMLSLISEKFKQLDMKRKQLQSQLKDREPQRNYALHIKEPLVPPRLIRVGTAGSAGAESGDSDQGKKKTEFLEQGFHDIVPFCSPQRFVSTLDTK